MISFSKEQAGQQLFAATACLVAGKIIAYPTEAVFGLGCDPRNDAAIEKLLVLKKRPADKGLILIAADFAQLKTYCQPLPQACWRTVQSSWPGPHTWLFPAAVDCSPLLTGQHTTIAVRVSAHPTVRALCRLYGHAIVSTSANHSQQKPACSCEEVRAMLGDKLCCIISAAVGNDKKPTPIRDALSGAVIRA